VAAGRQADDDGDCRIGAPAMNALRMIVLAAQLAAPVRPALVRPAPARSVEIVLFSDFQCPFCAQLAGPIRELQKTPPAGVDVTVRFRHFPLGIHPAAPLAHQAALAAAEQHKFWEMHDLLFANRQHAQREDLIGYAAQLGLDVQRFTTDLDSDRIKQAIEDDKGEGARRHVEGTPTFYVNGREYVGTRSLAQLKQIVAGEERRTRALAEIGDGALSRGPADAPVTIELFADLQSPVTRPAMAVLNAVIARYRSEVRLQFRNFPLAFHPQAPLAHEAAMIAARSSRFWDFAASLLDHQDSVREPDLIALAGRLGLDEKAFAEALRDHRYLPRVDADVEDGDRRGIRGSPVIVVNGKRIDGVPSLQTLTEYVDAAVVAPLLKRP
jgi:protein-disulfide isomerase